MYEISLFYTTRTLGTSYTGYTLLIKNKSKNHSRLVLIISYISMEEKRKKPNKR
jgi:hypothetical protein